MTSYSTRNSDLRWQRGQAIVELCCISLILALALQATKPLILKLVANQLVAYLDPVSLVFFLSAQTDHPKAKVLQAKITAVLQTKLHLKASTAEVTLQKGGTIGSKIIKRGVVSVSLRVRLRNVWSKRIYRHYVLPN